MARQGALSVLMLPWLAHGHISPFLELAKQLTARNFFIYFCSTPINLDFVSRSLDGSYSTGIQLVQLHLPSSPDLPPHYHTTKGLPPHLIPALTDAFDQSATPHFSNILRSLSPDLLIYDLHRPWAPALASSHGIPAVEFLPFTACMTSFYKHFFRNSGSEYPFPEIYLNDYERAKFAQLHDESVLECLGRSKKILIIKSFREIEGKYLDHLSSLMHKKMVPAGPLIQDLRGEGKEEEVNYKTWLDEKDPLSTVFISFGSEYYLSREEMAEIAKGLELSKVNFIWAIRFPGGERKSAKEELPNGFLGRVGGRGFIVEGWAPQVKLLQHPSVGGFVSHCGWSSTMESLQLGVPIIAMPMQFDQPINARLVAATGVGMPVERDNDGRFRGEEIAEVISKVMLEKTGESMRGKARDLSDIMKYKGHQEIDELSRELVQLCKEENHTGPMRTVVPCDSP